MATCPRTAEDALGERGFAEQRASRIPASADGPQRMAEPGQRLLLHFGAVDWEATVFVNGREMGAHRGGYDGFRFDITDALRPSGCAEAA